MSELFPALYFFHDQLPDSAPAVYRLRAEYRAGAHGCPYGWTDWRRFALLAGVLFLLGIYAAGWQVILKKFNLGVAYANRSAVVIWGILLAWLCLGEALSWTLAAGAALVIGGIILVSTEEAHE